MGTDQEFREKVLVILTDVQTKMNSLVGVDGNEGRVADLDSRVKSLETDRTRIWGAGIVLVFLWETAVAVVGHFRK